MTLEKLKSDIQTVLGTKWKIEITNKKAYLTKDVFCSEQILLMTNLIYLISIFKVTLAFLNRDFIIRTTSKCFTKNDYISTIEIFVNHNVEFIEYEN